MLTARPIILLPKKYNALVFLIGSANRLRYVELPAATMSWCCSLAIRAYWWTSALNIPLQNGKPTANMLKWDGPKVRALVSYDAKQNAQSWRKYLQLFDSIHLDLTLLNIVLLVFRFHFVLDRLNLFCVNDINNECWTTYAEYPEPKRFYNQTRVNWNVKGDPWH
jgi:hypothetical protein